MPLTVNIEEENKQKDKLITARTDHEEEPSNKFCSHVKHCTSIGSFACLGGSCKKRHLP